MEKKHMSLAAVMREAIRLDGRSLSRLAQESGVDHGILSRFMRGERDMTLQTAEAICRVLGLELRSAQRKG